VLGDEHLDRGVVGRDDPVEAPLVAEDRRQQLARCVTRHAVDVAVGRHDARDAGVRTAASNGSAALAELARADVGRGLVEPALGEAVAGEVLAVAATPVARSGPCSPRT
jgi:hypothetical protein